MREAEWARNFDGAAHCLPVLITIHRHGRRIVSRSPASLAGPPGYSLPSLYPARVSPPLPSLPDTPPPLNRSEHFLLASPRTQPCLPLPPLRRSRTTTPPPASAAVSQTTQPTLTSPVVAYPLLPPDLPAPPQICLLTGAAAEKTSRTIHSPGPNGTLPATAARSPAIGSTRPPPRTPSPRPLPAARYLPRPPPVPLFRTMRTMPGILFRITWPGAPSTRNTVQAPYRAQRGTASSSALRHR